MVAERGFDGGNVLVRDADFVSKRAKDGIGFVERGKGAIAEAFAVRLELFEDVEARTKLSLLAEQAIKVLADLGLFSLNFAESGLALLDGAAAGFDGKLVGLDVGGEFLEPGDILLSWERSVISVGIRLMTFAPVSHAAVYVGDSQIVDAMRQGVRARELAEFLEEAAVVLVLRHPELSAEQAAVITEYSVNKSGAGFNFLGIALHVPFSIARRVCELPLVHAAIRDACIRTFGVLHRLAASERRFFCSQLVLQAYRHAGVLVTHADPRLISPADILHMREDDVSSVAIVTPLRYVGHLKSAGPASALASLE